MSTKKLTNPYAKLIGEYKYFLNQRLGRGTFGEVFLGCLPGKIPELAIKIIPLKPSELDHLKKCLEREEKILLQINHPNIVKLHKTFILEANIYMIYERCEKDLTEYCNNKNISEDETINFMKQICEGYHELQRNGIMHRDLKPANLLLQNGFLKLADFGSAKHFSIKVDKSPWNTPAVGTPAYSSPEMFMDPNYDDKCDVWSLGIILYEMLYGKTPWECLNLFGYFTKVLKTEKLQFPKEPKRSIKIKKLISQMLVYDPKLRIGWEEVFEEVASFEEIEKIWVKRKVQIVEKKQQMQKFQEVKKTTIYEEEKLQESEENIKKKLSKKLENLDLEDEQILEIAQKKRKKENEKAELMLFYRNLAFFFQKCSSLLALSKDLIEINKKIFYLLSNYLKKFHYDLLIKIREQSSNTMNEQNIKNNKKIAQNDYKDFDDELNYDFEEFKNTLRGWLKNNVTDCLTKENLEENLFSLDLFKFLLFLFVFLGADSPKRIFAGNADLSTFIDKIEKMKKRKMILEINNTLRRL